MLITFVALGFVRCQIALWCAAPWTPVASPGLELYELSRIHSTRCAPFVKPAPIELAASLLSSDRSVSVRSVDVLLPAPTVASTQ
jgi:hypothetical protein